MKENTSKPLENPGEEMETDEELDPHQGRPLYGYFWSKYDYSYISYLPKNAKN